ncbi:polysaccharide pyruvyl transferase family protein [Bacteroides uniformis]|uniref:polysaccharide pyruvyl transferase family protein n=1 Tax=Bacteroides uniformis TaxID=820 RepID=UPI001897AB58|nr:polysaccharide pyruvyl transferase family protein [Bacteroides uniformis]
MKKLALLSFHNAVNYGAALQAYALQNVLSEMGYNCEYINYQNEQRQNEYNMIYHVIKCLKKKMFRTALVYCLGSPFMAIRKIRFRKFYKRYLKCTETIYSTSQSVAVLNRQYDKFIVGSDQVWNYEHNGKDFAFLLDFVEKKEKKISYSSSFGLCSIPDEFLEKYRTYLNDIQYLSVRESYGVEIIRKLTGRIAKLVLDPVFLMKKEDWQSLCHLINEKYVFSYTNQPHQFETFLNQISFNIRKYKHYKLARATTISDFLSNSIKVKYTMSPIDFISVINCADLVVSASFHCISLAIILNRPFVAILSDNIGKDERVLSLLNLLGLQDRIFSSSMTLDDVKRKIDYDKINQKIVALRNDSLLFLKESIENN